MRKIKDFLLTDIKVINKYFLVIFTIVLLTIVGATSYALFTYELESNNSFGVKYVKIEAPSQETLLVCDDIGQEEGDEQGNFPNEPTLASNMIPVCYNSENNVWVKADERNMDETHQWYSYSNKYWANAVTVTDASRSTYVGSEAGTVINMNDITNMLVWIPAYVYGYNDLGESYASGTVDAPGAIDILFLNYYQYDTTVYLLPSVFQRNSSLVPGIWVGKFKLSHETITNEEENNLGCQGPSCNNANGLRTLPNKKMLSNNNVSNFFFGIKSMQATNNAFGFTENVDVHMIKNSEWGVIVYLTQSIHGRCEYKDTCKKVEENTNANLLTGYGSNESGNEVSYELATESTSTGNIYGVYDLNVAFGEAMMSNYTNDVTTITTPGLSGFVGQTLINFKNINGTGNNIDFYVSDDDLNACPNQTLGTSVCFGQALYETSGWGNDTSYSFVREDSPWLYRGYQSIFFVDSYDGSAVNELFGTRIIVTPYSY